MHIEIECGNCGTQYEEEITDDDAELVKDGSQSPICKHCLNNPEHYDIY